ncbi:Dynactin subunit 6 [Manis javanica]|nr:Dynactin subunit 6 [Manis javanica]
MAEKTQKSVKIAPGAVVCVESEIRGDVTIGPRTVIHPKARIIAEAGPIVIGEGNLIEEQALIINAHPDNITPDTEDPEPKPMIIGTNNVFEVGCYSQAMKMGDNNVIESKAYVGRNVILTSGCIVGACCNLNTYEVVPENTVIYGTDCLRRVQSERPQPQTLQLDFLMKILPNYHHLKKTMKGSSTPIPPESYTNNTTCEKSLSVSKVLHKRRYILDEGQASIPFFLSRSSNFVRVVHPVCRFTLISPCRQVSGLSPGPQGELHWSCMVSKSRADHRSHVEFLKSMEFLDRWTFRG